MQTIDYIDNDKTETLSLLSGTGSPALRISGSRNSLTLLAANLGGIAGAPAVILSGANIDADRLSEMLGARS